MPSARSQPSIPAKTLEVPKPLPHRRQWHAGQAPWGPSPDSLLPSPSFKNVIVAFSCLHIAAHPQPRRRGAPPSASSDQSGVGAGTLARAGLTRPVEKRRSAWLPRRSIPDPGAGEGGRRVAQRARPCSVLAPGGSAGCGLARAKPRHRPPAPAPPLPAGKVPPPPAGRARRPIP